MLRSVFNILGNKYLITGVVFLAWLVFFDNNNLIRQYGLRAELKGLQKEKQYYLEQIEINRIATEELMTNQSTLEKFAREKYLMKRENEDIYLIIQE